MEILCLIICAIVGYLIGSIPFAIVIGKLFFNIDIREYGSKNAGGTNAGRVLGKRVGVIVIVLDALKIVIVMAINILIIKVFFNIGFDNMTYTYCQEVAVFMAVLGHCYPIYCNFRGGKAVSSTAGVIVATNYICFPFGVVTFFATLFSTKIVSLSSILSGFVCVIVAFIEPLAKHGMWFYLQYDIVYPLTILAIFALLLFRHRENIIRLKNHDERKIAWLKSNKKS